MKTKLDEEREERIAMEIIVDAYGLEEQAMVWYYYHKDTIEFPFSAVCCGRRSISPLKIDDKVKVVGMADEGECEKECLWLFDGVAVSFLFPCPNSPLSVQR